MGTPPPPLKQNVAHVTPNLAGTVIFEGSAGGGGEARREDPLNPTPVGWDSSDPDRNPGSPEKQDVLISMRRSFGEEKAGIVDLLKCLQSNIRNKNLSSAEPVTFASKCLSN